MNEGVFWDHRTAQSISGVVAVNTVLAACPLDQKSGLYLVRFQISPGALTSATLVEFTVGANTPATAADRYQFNWISFVVPASGECFCQAQIEHQVIHGPCAPSTEARIYLRTAMVISDAVAVSICARYLGGIRAAGPLSPS